MGFTSSPSPAVQFCKIPAKQRKVAMEDVNVVGHLVVLAVASFAFWVGYHLAVDDDGDG